MLMAGFTGINHFTGYSNRLAMATYHQVEDRSRKGRLAKNWSQITKLTLVLAAGWMLAGTLSATAGYQSDWRDKMRRIVPENYLCRHASAPIVIDGKLDEPDWANAPWMEDFVDIQGTSKPAPRFHT